MTNDTPSTIHEQMKRAIELDAVTDGTMVLWLDERLNDVRQRLHTAVFYLSRAERAVDLEKVAPYIRDDIHTGLLETDDIADELDQAEQYLTNLSYRLRGARAGETDPSTVTPAERMKRRTDGIRRLADGSGEASPAKETTEAAPTKETTLLDGRRE